MDNQKVNELISKILDLNLELTQLFDELLVLTTKQIDTHNELHDLNLFEKRLNQELEE